MSDSDQRPTDLSEIRKQRERKAYTARVLEIFGEMERGDKREVLDRKAEVQIKARERL